ncbi:preprotein translocase subunit SecA [Candidatus Halobeggiatoa sp. HSG11]|nr:preprotein translocase subunit SecA [Candidatus Halobeggiatoa sp. HSG11]
MFKNVLTKMFGSRNDRLVKQLFKTVKKINDLEPEISALNDDELKAKTVEFRQRVKDGTTLDDLLPEAFATVREAGKRTLNMRHFDVQLIGGMVLHSGKIGEMRTGEGKTLVATLAVYLNALSGNGVHVITVNDYLAKRDAEWMGNIYEFLGMTVGVSLSGMSTDEKREAYGSDITYGTNNEFGFDYLRDNMAFSSEDKVQRKLNFAVIDEVDSILIDEARTPLIISGPTDDNSDLYKRIDVIIPILKPQERETQKDEEVEVPGDYYVDEKQKQVSLSDEGHRHIEEALVSEGILKEGESLYDAANISMMHHILSALRAHTLFQLDVDYIVKDDQIVIVDEFTGRQMPGRRWSEGLHQAVEAKEKVTIQNENQTLASITFQNLFRLYNKLSGMTGTADTEAYEFQQIYGLEVVVIPTNEKMVRDDKGDLVYLTVEAKYKAIIEDVKNCQIRKQPVLVGTTSIESSELLSKHLEQDKITHKVLNARFHEQEASIITQAGTPGAVTIATNMAGRGTDIVLGGSIEEKIKALGNDPDKQEVDRLREEWEQLHASVLNSGGLHIIGTERHESRRIDNQLRGRSGRQGDPGSSRFYLSLQDNLMRIFASERVSKLMQKFGMEDDEAIEHPWVTRAIENAQRKVEGRNFDIRKELLEYDDIANDQRKIIYEQRNELMSVDSIEDTINIVRHDVLRNVIDGHITPNSLEELWDISGLEANIEQTFAQKMPIAKWLEEDHDLHEETLRKKIEDDLITAYKEKERLAGVEVVRHFEKAVMLQILDGFWKEHLAAMDHLRQGIHLESYAQKNPKHEYKRKAFELFSGLLDRIKIEIIGVISKVKVNTESDVEVVEEQRRQQQNAPNMQFRHAKVPGLANEIADNAPPPPPPEEAPQKPFVRKGPKIGRNAPCPCGSGKKYKQCHGKITS